MYADINERVSVLKSRLLHEVPFFGYLAIKCQVIFTEEVPTAAVSRDSKMYFNPNFAATLSDQELTGVILHEVSHLAWLCFARQGTRDAVVRDSSGGRMSLWNIAHDYAINLAIDGMCRPYAVLPKGCLLDSKYEDLSAEEIYDLLLEELDTVSIPSWGEGDTEGGPDDSDGGGDDDSDGNGDGGYKKPLEDYDKDWEQAVVEAAQVHEARKKGTLPASIKKLISEITDPRVDWREVLAQWVGENGNFADFTYRRPSRRSAAVGEYLPSVKKSGVEDVTVFWDTSGSMGDREVEIASEVIGIVRDMGMSVRVIVCDAAVHGDFRDVEDVEDIDLSGGGGSDFGPAFALLEEEDYEGVVLAFTDGYISVPAMAPQHLTATCWVLWDSHRDNPPADWGDVIRVTADGYVEKTRC